MSIIEKAIERLKDNQTDLKTRSGDADRAQGGPPIDGNNLHKFGKRTDSSQSKQTAAPKIINLDLDSLRANGVVPQVDSKLNIDDQLRKIKFPVISNAFGKNAALTLNSNVLMVTSSLEGEGKTFISLNLALSLALERDKTVLLIDADPKKRSLSQLIGAEKEPGLINMLSGDVKDLEDVIFKTDYPNLSFLPAGDNQNYISELFSSKKMQNLISSLAKQDSQCIVIFDVPPLLATPEAHALAHFMGQTLFVVKSSSTPQRVVQDALELLDTDQTIGLILNQHHELFSSKHTGGYYGSER